MTTATIEFTSPGTRLARSSLVALIQDQVVRIAMIRAEIAGGRPVTGDLAAELRELELLQDRLDGD